MLSVGAVVARPAPWHNRLAIRLQHALVAALAAHPRVTLSASRDLARDPLPEHAAFVVNCSARSADALRPRLPAGVPLVEFHYREADAVSLPLSALWRRPALIPGQRAVLAAPATVALSARLVGDAGRPPASLGHWEGRAHHKRAGRAVEALVAGAPLLLGALADHLADGGALHDYPPLRDAPPPALPLRHDGTAVGTGLRYAAHLLWDTVVRRWRPDEAEQWGIGVAPATDGLAPRADAIRWAHPPPDRGFADPFLFSGEQGRWLFFEEIPHGGAHGFLVAAPVTNGGTVDLPHRRLVLRAPHHLSFPTLHLVGDALYLLCEEGGAGVVRLHRCARFPDVWEPLPPLVPGIAGADPVLWRHDGHWYLFVTDARGGNHDNHLQLFVADAIAGPYRRHPDSPVRFGLSGSRMAGAIVETGTGPLRLGQECTARYGGAVCVFAIEEATPHRYRERYLRTLAPVPGSPYPLARHTHTACDGFVALDGVRMVPLPRP